MKTKLGDDIPFNPCPDYLIQVYGLMTAAVWGKIYRYCTMDDGFCHASKERMALELGITRRAFIHHAKILVDAGYFSVFCEKGKPNAYRDTGLMMQRYLVAGGVNEIHTPTTEKPENPEPVNEIHRGVNEIHTGCEDNSQGVCTTFTGGVNEIHTNKVFNKEPNKEFEERREETLVPTKQKEQIPESEPSVVVVSILDIYEKNFHQMADETKAEQLNTLVETLSYQATARAVEFCAARRLDFGYVPTYAKYYANQPVTA